MSTTDTSIAELPTEEEKSQALSTKKRLHLTEDWLAVFIGGFIIAVFLGLAASGSKSIFTLPTYKWIHGPTYQVKYFHFLISC